MKIITVRTQGEMDKISDRFDEYTVIEIRSKKRIYIEKIWDNSSVVARDNSSVEAWDNSSVVAHYRATIQIMSERNIIGLGDYSTGIISTDLKKKIKKLRKSKHAYLITVSDIDFFVREGIEQRKGKVILFKRVSNDFQTQENSPNETLWKPDTIVEHLDWDPYDSECGSGKFHAVSRPYFADEFRNVKDDRYIAIEVDVKDTYEWKDDIIYPHKIGFRKGKVLYECDRFGKKKGGEK